jgi:predicted O-methyltransferase YrrM
MLYEILTNSDSVVLPDRLGRVIPQYRKTYSFPGPFINADHAWWSTCPTTAIRVGVRPQPRDEKAVTNPQYDARDVFGALRRADALKLYEMAYYCGGNIVELGTAFGLSCSIMCQALEAAGGSGRIDTVDIAPETQKLAMKAIGRLPGHQRVRCHLMDGTEFLRRYAERGERAAFVFVDHTHQYVPVREAARLLDAVIAPGGFVLFHDYNDWRNSDPKDPAYADLWAKVDSRRFAEFSAYGVYQAAHDGLSANFEFHGVFGCTGLFRKAR